MIESCDVFVCVRGMCVCHVVSIGFVCLSVRFVCVKCGPWFCMFWLSGLLYVSVVCVNCLGCVSLFVPIAPFVCSWFVHCVTLYVSYVCLVHDLFLPSVYSVCYVFNVSMVC